MARKPDDLPSEEADGGVDEMFQHLDEAKELDGDELKRARQRSSGSQLQREMKRRTDVAVLASNHEVRLEEIVENDAVTHRSGKAWKSAKVGVEAHGRLPIYYRLDGEVKYTGYISKIVLNPGENTAAAEEFRQYITEDDTYSDYSDELDTTTFIVTEGKRLDDPFPQSELQKLNGEGTVDEDYSYQPAYVIQRPGDFPDFP